MRILASAAIVAALVVPALAGGEGKGFRCDNCCPLAQEANLRRSYGLESQSASKVARADVVAAVEKNLSKV
jgi:hypothetical protein